MNVKEKQDTAILDQIPFVRLLLLILIKKNPGVTGYDLMALVAKFSNNLINLKSGTTYSELRKLEKFNLVSSSLSKVGRKKREYLINSDGEKFINKTIEQIKTKIDNLLIPLIKLNEV